MIFLNIDFAIEKLKEFQLKNILADHKKEVILIEREKLKDGYGHNFIPDEILLASVELKNGERINGIIINDFIVISEIYLIDYENGDLILIGESIFKKSDFPYEEISIK